MKYFYYAFAFALTTAMFACGSSNNTAGLAYTSGANPVGGNGTSTGCINGTCSIPGGTETVTQMFYSTVSQVDASKTFTTSLPVVTGDRVLVMMSPAYETTSSTSLFSIQTSSYLSAATASVSGVTLGNLLNAEYVVPTAGNLTVSIDWPLSSGNSGTRNVYFTSAYGVANVYVLHCTNTSGVVMPCPAY